MGVMRSSPHIAHGAGTRQVAAVPRSAFAQYQLETGVRAHDMRLAEAMLQITLGRVCSSDFELKLHRNAYCNRFPLFQRRREQPFLCHGSSMRSKVFVSRRNDPDVLRCSVLGDRERDGRTPVFPGEDAGYGVSRRGPTQQARRYVVLLVG